MEGKVMDIVEWMICRGHVIADAATTAWWHGWQDAMDSSVTYHGWYTIGGEEYTRRMGIALDYLTYAKEYTKPRWVSDDEMLYSGEVKGGCF
jgi:hypothetical protein